MAAKKTLLIVDDHTLFREGLKTIISRNPAYESAPQPRRRSSVS
jgi:DNA-binding NarL/FixJ family response regulator